MFALNHQNALMDAMAILFAANRQLVFLARSDIFKNPRVASVLYFLKILPVFRIRDGFENLKNNNEIFQNTVRVLNYPRGLAILPEGNHAGYKRLRQLQKGFARIAFQTMESDTKSKEFYIIPTGLEYEHYEKYGKHLIVNFGEPFEISPYFETYKTNPAQGLTELRDRLETELKKVMIQISSEKWYELILKLTDWNWIRLENQGERAIKIYKQNQQLAEKLSGLSDNDPQWAHLEQLCIEFDTVLSDCNLNASEIAEKGTFAKQLIINLALFPLIIIGVPAFITFGWLYILVKNSVKKKIKDPQFRTSIRFGLYTIAIIPLVLLLNLWTLAFFPWYSYLIAIVGTSVSGIIGLKTVPFFIKAVKRLKSSVLDFFGNRQIRKAIELRKKIFEQLIQINC